MADPFGHPILEDLDFLVEALNLLDNSVREDALDLYSSSDEEDVGELEEVRDPLFLPRRLSPPDEEEEAEQDEDQGIDQGEEWDEDDPDSGYESLFQEDDEDEEGGDEDDQRFSPEEIWQQEAPPAQAVGLVVRPPSPYPQQQAKSPSAAAKSYEDLLRSWDLQPHAPYLAPPSPPILDAAPGPSPAPTSPPLGGAKRARDEEDPSSSSSKMSRSADNPSPSTSSVMFGGLRYFTHPPQQLFQDSNDSDTD